jgi:hypothetical protein
MKSISLLALAVAFCTFSLRGSQAAMAVDDERQFTIQLERLRTAREVVLMILPQGTSYRSRLTREHFRNVACVYQISSVNRSVFGDAINLLKDGVLEYTKGPEPLSTIRIVMVFQGNGVSDEFSFEDWNRRQNAIGVSGEYRILASTDLPDQLRSLALRPNALLVSGPSQCSHS